MAECSNCGKKARINKHWKVSKGFYSTYYSCPACSKDNPQKEAYRDLRIKRVD